MTEKIKPEDYFEQEFIDRVKWLCKLFNGKVVKTELGEKIK